MMRHLADLRIQTCRSGGAGNESILIGVTSGDFPGVREISVQTNLVAIRALATGLHYPGRIVRIGCPRVRTIQPKDRRIERQETIQVPLSAYFIIAKLFR